MWRQGVLLGIPDSFGKGVRDGILSPHVIVMINLICWGHILLCRTTKGYILWFSFSTLTCQDQTLNLWHVQMLLSIFLDHECIRSGSVFRPPCRIGYYGIAGQAKVPAGGSWQAKSGAWRRFRFPSNSSWRNWVVVSTLFGTNCWSGIDCPEHTLSQTSEKKNEDNMATSLAKSKN